MASEVLFGVNGIYAVRQGGSTVRCRIKGKRLRSEERSWNPLAPGDLVEVAPDPLSRDAGLITGVLPRRTVLRRWSTKGRVPQVVAANADLAVCVTSARVPPFRPRFIDRLAAAAEDGGLDVLIVLNKIDLGVPDEVRERLADYQRLGYGVHGCSAVSGEGIGELRALLLGRTAVLVGQSGVGKSSLINVLAPAHEQRVGAVSPKHDRGSHTTSCAVLLEAEGLRTIDTPGIRELALADIAPEDLAHLFREFVPLVEGCPVVSCLHEEERGCAVRRAAEEGRVHPDRYESYRRLLEELRDGRRRAHG